VLDNVISLLKELIEGGFIGQAVIGTLVWGLITFLIVQRASVDNRLYDAGFIVIGYLFHMAQTAAATRAARAANKVADDCVDELTNERG
jgi:hypothetical protein